ncbi:hypothetical protein PHBOTO_004518 [Pseudozyma hubeiensis]|nr:hypothetical protein PHBOTO_004518 [Pseudozyma hubeiensis]
MQRIKQSVARLETLLGQRPSDAALPTASSSRTHASTATADHAYRIDPIQDLPGELDPPSREDRRRWQQLRAVLPPLIDTHRMMHYLLVEGDWLMPYREAPRFVALWTHSYERQAITDIFAVRVLTLVACSALLISDNRKRVIQFAVPIRSLHTKLAKEAMRIVESMPALRSGRTEAETCDLIEVMLSMSFYFRCIAKETLMGRFTERAISLSMRAGFDNELRPCWLGLTTDQVERRRILMMELVMSTKWLAFHCRKDLAPLRIMSFSFGQPHLERIGQLPPLQEWPEWDQLARNAAAQSLYSFTWRSKSDAERDTVRNFLNVSSSLTNEIPPLIEFVSKTEAQILQPEALARCTKEDMRDMARQTRQILARLEEWYTVLLPKAGVGYDRAVNANITSADFVEAKTMASILMVNSAVFYMTSIICRAWLLLSDRLQSLSDARRDDENDYETTTAVDSNFLTHFSQRGIDDVQQIHASWLPSTFLSEMQATVVENGKRCIRGIAVTRTLQSLSSSQFYVGWTTQAYLQAAVNLAIPLVRSHRRHFQQHIDDVDSGFANTSTEELRRDIVTIFEAVSELSDNFVAQRTAKVLNRALRFSGLERPLTHIDDDADQVEDAWAAEEQASSTSVAGQMQNAAEGLALLSAASSARTASDGAASKHSGSSGSSETSSPGVSMLGWDATSRSIANSHKHMVPFHTSSPLHPSAAAPATAAVAGEGPSREPMWWESRLPVEMTPHSVFGAGLASGAGANPLLGHQHHQQQQLHRQHQPSSQPQPQAQAQQPHHMSDSQLLEELLNFDPSFWQFVVDGAGSGGPGNENTIGIPT